MNNMVFIGGVHGVGKTSFCKSLCEKYNISSYSASQLITRRRNEEFALDKKVGNISGNQNVLLEAVMELEMGQKRFLLDGHFCLINKEGIVDRIPESTFIKLKPKGIIVLVDSVEKILERINRRDGINSFENGFMEKFQNEELSYSREIANKLNIPYLVHEMANSLEEVDEFFKKIDSN